jgi:hypothetical protein
MREHLILNDGCDPTVNLFRSEFTPLNLTLAESHFPCELVNAASQDCQQDTVGVLVVELFLSAAEKHQLVPLLLQKTLSRHGGSF